MARKHVELLRKLSDIMSEEQVNALLSGRLVLHTDDGDGTFQGMMLATGGGVIDLNVGRIRSVSIVEEESSEESSEDSSEDSSEEDPTPSWKI